MDRRGFIRKIGRNVILGGMVAGGAYLLFKPETGVACDFNFICRDCKKLKGCKLPEAEKYKETEKVK